jgi:Family of unknown function (DUF5906)
MTETNTQAKKMNAVRRAWTLTPSNSITNTVVAPKALDFLDLHQLLTIHEARDQKAGAVFIPGAASAIRSKAVSEMSCMVFDIDKSQSYASVRDTVIASGYVAFMYTTFSHGSTATVLNADKWRAWVKKVEHLGFGDTPTITGIELFNASNGIGDVNITGLDDKARSHGTEGIGFRYTHAPIDKFRLIFPLNKPFVAADSDSISDARWRSLYRGGAEKFGLLYDESCTDRARRFYSPTHPRTATNFKAEVLNVPTDFRLRKYELHHDYFDAGSVKFLDLSDITPVTKTYVRAERVEGDTSDTPTNTFFLGGKVAYENERDSCVGEFSINRWLFNEQGRRERGLEFYNLLSTKTYEDGLPVLAGGRDRGPHGNGCDIRCAFRDTHTDQEKTTGTFIDPGMGPNGDSQAVKGLKIFCSHSHCQQNKDHQERSQIFKWLQTGLITVDELQACDLPYIKTRKVNPHQHMLDSVAATLKKNAEEVAAQAEAEASEAASEDTPARQALRTRLAAFTFDAAKRYKLEQDIQSAAEEAKAGKLGVSSTSLQRLLTVETASAFLQECSAADALSVSVNERVMDPAEVVAIAAMAPRLSMSEAQKLYTSMWNGWHITEGGWVAALRKLREFFSPRAVAVADLVAARRMAVITNSLLRERGEWYGASYADMRLEFEAVVAEQGGETEREIAQLSQTLSSRYAKLQGADSLRIINLAEFERTGQYATLTPAEFIPHTCLTLKPVVVDGKTKLVSVPDYWLNRDNSVRVYTAAGMLMSAQERRENPDAFNKFYGFPKMGYPGFSGRFVGQPPKDDACALLLDHILNIWCSGRIDIYHHVLTWFAGIVQQPHVKPTWALLVKGDEGTGKTVVTDFMLKCLGNYGGIDASGSTLTSVFNTEQADKLMWVIEETSSTQTKDATGKLKNMITGDTMRLEGKGVDSTSLPSKTRYVLLSNEMAPVKISEGDRRYLILKTVKTHVGNAKYFSALFESIRAPGVMEAWGHYLMNYKPEDHGLSFGVLLTAPPVTEEKVEQVGMSADPAVVWLRTWALNGAIHASAQNAEHLAKLEMPRWELDAQMSLMSSKLAAAVGLQQGRTAVTESSVRAVMKRLVPETKVAYLPGRNGTGGRGSVWPKRREVLQKMVAARYITQADMDEAVRSTDAGGLT